MGDVTIRQVVDAGILPNRRTPRSIGTNWFKDDISGVVYHIELNTAGKLVVIETRQSKIMKSTPS